MSLSPDLIRVFFLLLPQSLVLDWAGPAETLRIANQCLIALKQPARFALHFISPQVESQSSVGVTIGKLEPLPTTFDNSPAWIVVVGQTGPKISLADDATRAAVRWLRNLTFSTGTLELVTVCAGTVLAAHAGLLVGRKATTHHRHLEDLKIIEPRCEVVPNRVFVLDSPVFSSAGVTTGVDLVLNRVREICGPALAAQVAQILVLPLRRGEHDPELSPFLAYRNHLHPAVHRVQDAMGDRPDAEWTVQGMAEVAHTTPRHLARLFQTHAGIAPLGYLRRIRLARAQLALASGDSVSRAAQLAGFASALQLRRAWHHFGLAGTPSGAAANEVPK